MDDFFDTLGRNNIGIPSNLTMMVRGLATIEGVVAMLDENINIMDIVASRARKRMYETFDLRRELTKNGRTVAHSVKKAIDIPGTVSDLLHMMLKGQTRFDLNLHPAPELASLMRKITENVVIGLVDSALLIASSILCLTDIN